MLRVQRWDAEHDGILTASRVKQRFEAQGLWVSDARFQPATRQEIAATGHDQLQVVLSGLLKVTVAGDSAILAAGDTVFVPRGTGCLLEVVGSTPVAACFAAFLPNGPRSVRGLQASPADAVCR